MPLASPSSSTTPSNKPSGSSVQKGLPPSVVSTPPKTPIKSTPAKPKKRGGGGGGGGGGIRFPVRTTGGAPPVNTTPPPVVNTNPPTPPQPRRQRPQPLTLQSGWSWLLSTLVSPFYQRQPLEDTPNPTEPPHTDPPEDEGHQGLFPFGTERITDGDNPFQLGLFDEVRPQPQHEPTDHPPVEDDQRLAIDENRDALNPFANGLENLDEAEVPVDPDPTQPPPEVETDREGENQDTLIRPHPMDFLNHPDDTTPDETLGDGDEDNPFANGFENLDAPPNPDPTQNQPPPVEDDDTVTDPPPAEDEQVHELEFAYDYPPAPWRYDQYPWFERHTHYLVLHNFDPNWATPLINERTTMAQQGRTPKERLVNYFNRANLQLGLINRETFQDVLDDDANEFFGQLHNPQLDALNDNALQDRVEALCYQFLKIPELMPNAPQNPIRPLLQAGVQAMAQRNEQGLPVALIDTVQAVMYRLLALNVLVQSWQVPDNHPRAEELERIQTVTQNVVNSLRFGPRQNSNYQGPSIEDTLTQAFSFDRIEADPRTQTRRGFRWPESSRAAQRRTRQRSGIITYLLPFTTRNLERNPNRLLGLGVSEASPDPDRLRIEAFENVAPLAQKGFVATTTLEQQPYPHEAGYGDRVGHWF